MSATAPGRRAPTTRRVDRRVVAAGALVGIGMGGFVDGILFHQILQLHNMLSSWIPKDTIANVEINMVWDGLFHAFCWIAVAAGLALLWRALRHRGSLPSGRSVVGTLALGWGMFNVVEGIIDHEVLQVHHVYQNGPHLPWDLAFLASGVILMAIGWRPALSSGRDAAPLGS